MRLVQQWTPSVLLALALVSAHPQAWGREGYWRRMNGPVGGTVQSLATDGSVVVASITSNGQLYATSDCGNSWRLINPPGEKLWSVVANESTIFALGSSYTRLWRTTNRGQSWQVEQIYHGGATYSTGLWLYGRNLYLGTMAGFHVSSDGGRTWSTAILSDDLIEEVLQVGRYLFVGTSRGVHSSADLGQTFTFAPLGYVTALVVHDSIVYAGTAIGEVHRTTDFGSSWHRVGYSGGGIVFSLAVLDSALLAGTQYSGVRISRDGGKTWTSTGLHSHYVYALLTTPSCIYAGTRYDGVQVSRDRGNTWQDPNLSAMSIEALAAFGHVLLAAQRYAPAIYRSVDRGETWSRIPVPTPFVFDFAGGDGKLFAGARDGVLVSFDDGRSWTLRGGQLYGQNVFAVAYAGGYLYAGTGGGGILVSSDDGEHWVTGSGLPLGTYVYDLLDVDGTVFAAAEAIYASTDKGLTWESRNSTGRGTGLGRIESALFVVGYFGRYTVIRTTDFGRSWTEVAKGLSGNPLFLYSFATRGQDIFLGTNNGVFRSTNLGERWMAYNDSLRDGGEWVWRLASDERNLYVGSYESGTWWRPFAPPLMHLSTRSISFQDVEVGTSDSRVLEVWNTGSSPMTIHKVTVSNPRYAAHYHGAPVVPPGSSVPITITFSPTRVGEERGYLILKTDAFYSMDSVELDGLSKSGTKIRALGGVPEDYYVSQNFPNPFNSSTTIRFGLPTSDFVLVTVFDVTGSTIAEVFNEWLPAGRYEIRWQANNLSSGMYFLRFKALGFTSTKKIVYLK